MYSQFRSISEKNFSLKKNHKASGLQKVLLMGLGFSMMAVCDRTGLRARLRYYGTHSLLQEAS